MHTMSAYELNEEFVKDLIQELNEAVEKAKFNGKSEIVEREGEDFFLIHPSGAISLCTIKRTYILSDRECPKNTR